MPPGEDERVSLDNRVAVEERRSRVGIDKNPLLRQVAAWARCAVHLTFNRL